MRKKIFWLIIAMGITGPALSQTGPVATGPGIGFYPTGTEAGFGFRTGKETRLVGDIRLTKTNIYSDHRLDAFITEASLVYRLVRLEKVRFHVGLGFRSDWNFATGHQHGAVIPFGVEAFPFPFQNAGLFFECGIFGTFASSTAWHGGVRTAAGFVFYFPRSNKKTT